MNEISAALITKNEAASIRNCLLSIGELDDIVVVDTGSTDDTVAIAESFGARVFTMGNIFSQTTASEDDVISFTHTYGWKPSFIDGEKFFSFADARNFAMKQCKNDWILVIDADETIEWDIEKVKEELETCPGRLRSHLQQSETVSFGRTHIYNKHKFAWAGMRHNALFAISEDADETWTDNIKTTHHQLPKERISPTLAALEYMATVEEGPLHTRALAYLGREYVNAGQYDRSINILKRYLVVSDRLAEAAEACMNMSIAYIMQGNVNGARSSLLQALNINPNLKEAFIKLAILSTDEDAEVWMKYAELADNKDALYIRDIKIGD